MVYSHSSLFSGGTYSTLHHHNFESRKQKNMEIIFLKKLKILSFTVSYKFSKSIHPILRYKTNKTSTFHVKVLSTSLLKLEAYYAHEHFFIFMSMRFNLWV